jgi:hypothetical protein
MNFSRAASRYQVAGGGGRLCDLCGIQPSAFAEQAQMCKIVQNCAKLCKIVQMVLSEFSSYSQVQWIMMVIFFIMI